MVGPKKQKAQDGPGRKVKQFVEQGKCRDHSGQWPGRFDKYQQAKAYDRQPVGEQALNR